MNYFLSQIYFRITKEKIGRNVIFCATWIFSIHPTERCILKIQKNLCNNPFYIGISTKSHHQQSSKPHTHLSAGYRTSESIFNEPKKDYETDLKYSGLLTIQTQRAHIHITHTHHTSRKRLTASLTLMSTLGRLVSMDGKEVYSSIWDENSILFSSLFSLSTRSGK